MIIDFHTHIFPDAVAARAVSQMAEVSKTTPVSDGTWASLVASMRKNGVDYSVLLPVVTAPRQFDSVNRFVSALNGRDGLIAFGGIHPDCDDIPGKLRFIQEQGMRGIKLHPDYQGCFVDDDKTIALIRQAVARGLYVVIHSGWDPVSPDVVHTSPKRAARMLEAVNETGEPHIVLAHMGANFQFDEGEEYLIGKNVLLDTAFVLDKISPEQFCRMVRKHGAHRVLFATDSPWADAGQYARIFASLPLTQEEKDLILYKNAQKILF